MGSGRYYGTHGSRIIHHKVKRKQTGTNQFWFPKSWTQKDVVKAAEHVCGLKSNAHKSGAKILWGE